MDTNILFNAFPKESVARWNPVDGRAIIETPDGKVYSFDPARPPGQRVQEERMGFHSGMWLQPALAAGAGRPVEIYSPGEYPFTELEKHIEFRLRVNDALYLFLMSLDPGNEVQLRLDFARKATHALKEDGAGEAAERILMSNPMPKGLEPTYGPSEGRAGEILKAMVAKWRP